MLDDDHDDARSIHSKLSSIDSMLKILIVIGVLALLQLYGFGDAVLSFFKNVF